MDQLLTQLLPVMTELFVPILHRPIITHQRTLLLKEVIAAALLQVLQVAAVAGSKAQELLQPPDEAAEETKLSLKCICDRF